MSSEKQIGRTGIVILSLLLLPNAAFAYVDPGSGMLFWQGLLAAIGAVGVYFKSIRLFVGRMLRKIFKSARSER